MEEFHTYILPNGIRCVHRRVKSSVARCALIINAGSRDEHHDEYGLAHFTEHGFFKGTHRRRAYQVNCRLENLGGELNAYTTKEDTTVHATTMRSNFSEAVDLLSDVVFESTFPEHEIDKEREVIMDEINTYKDSPMDMIYDTFEDMLFAGSELGHNILGTRRHLERHNGESMRRFTARTHTTDRMVFASIGDISDSRIEQIAARYLAGRPATHRSEERIAPAPVELFDKSLNRHTHQTHCIMGNRAYGISDERRLPFSLLVNILGGPCANSILNVALRERYGLTYNIEASYTPYSDCGIAVIYFSSDHANAERCREIVAGEIVKLQNRLLTPRRLSMAKRQFIAQMAISTEGNEGYMLGVGKSLLVHDEIDTLEEVYRKIGDITASQIMEAANEVFADYSVLMYK